MTRIPVFIAGRGYLSGVSTWAEQIRKALADHPRYELQLLHIGEPGYEHADVVAADVEAATRHILESAPAIVFPNYEWELCFTGFAPDVQCIGMCHADSEQEYYHPLTWYESLISHFVGVSPECHANLSRRFGFRRDEISLLPYGIPVSPTLNRDYQIAPIRIVYAGRVTQLQKRVWDFIPLVQQLKAHGVNFTFDIVGDGDQRSALQEAIESRFSDGCVRFRGQVPHREMAAIWQSQDVFVQTSDFEGTSVSMLEAMASGVVPVVTAASSGVSGVIEPGVNGFVAPVGDMTKLAAAIAGLAASRDRLAAAGAAAHQTAQAYSLDKYAPRFVEILDQAMERGAAVDLKQRYGLFAGVHPMFAQQRVIANLREKLNEGGVRQMLKKLALRDKTPPKRAQRSAAAETPAPSAAKQPESTKPSVVAPSAIKFARPEEPGLVSIVMPTFRGERYIGAALATISNQRYANWELIIVEDGTENASEVIVRDFAARHPDNRVSYQKNGRRCGASFSRNLAFSKAAGEFVALLDCDDRWTPGHLERSVESLRSTGKDLVYSTVIFVADYDEMPLGTWGPTPHDIHAFPASLLGRNYITPSATVLRRQVLAEVGPWNTELRYCEDYEYWLRCIAAEKQFQWIGGCHCLYRKNHAGATTHKLCGTLGEVAMVTERFIGKTSVRAKTTKRLAAKAYAHAADYHVKSNPEHDPSADFAHAADLYMQAWRLRRSHLDYPILAAKIKLASLFRSRPLSAETTGAILGLPAPAGETNQAA